MQILSKVSSTVAVNLSVTPPDCDADADKGKEAHSGKAKKCDPKRDRYIKQPETGKKRQEQHCGYNEFPTLQFINGEAKNITDLAAKLGLKPPYVTRVLGLNNLAPDIVEAIVNGAEPDGLSIAQIMKNIPEDWNEQRRLFGFPER